MYMINLLAASPQGIAALATQGGTAALTERSDATFEVCQFLFADGAGLKPIKSGSLFD